MDGGAGDDILTGGAGDDVFVAAPGGGADVLADFGQGLDRLDLRAFHDRLGGLGIARTGADTLLQFAGGDSILLLGVPSITLQGDYVIA